MATHHIVECTCQRMGVQRTGEVQHERNVVNGVVGFELREEPEALLGIRQRNGALSVDGGQLGSVDGDSARDLLRQIRYGRRGEYVAHTDR